MLAPDGQLEALRLLVDHRDQLSSRRVQTVNRLHRLLAELTPGKVKKDLTALQAKAILAGVRPRDVAGKTRRQLAADELTDLIAVEKKIKALTIEIKAIVTERGSHLIDLPGVGPVVSARIVLADVGDVARWPWPGAAAAAPPAVWRPPLLRAPLLRARVPSHHRRLLQLLQR